MKKRFVRAFTALFLFFASFQLISADQKSNTSSTQFFSKSETELSEVSDMTKAITKTKETNQKSNLTGTVVDENGEPVIGASVIEKGTTNGVITDMNGTFHLSVGNNAVLQVSYIGFLSQDVAVKNQTQFKVILKEDTKALEEVVVIGYGTQRAKDLTTSATNISMKSVKDMPVTGVDQSLTGQVAGVNISSSNGIPGGGPQIQIRGFGAVGAGSQPLYVVDGFPLPVTSSQRSNPINDIPPQDIASITVLKDAAATAIYGSRGANGVILITTHRGRSGPPRVQLSAYTGVAQVIEQERPDLMNAREFAQFQKERHEDDGTPVPEVYKNPEKYGEGTNWFDEITRIAPTNEVNLSISGGNDKITSYFSVGYTNQQGVVLETGYQRFSVRGNIDAQLSKRLKVGVNVAPTYTLKNRAITAGDGRSTEIGWAQTANPIPSVYKEDGSYNFLVDDGGPDAWKYPNLVQSIKEVKQRTKSQRFIGSIYGEFSILPELTFKSTFNTDWTGNNYYSYKPSSVRDLNNPNITVPFANYHQYGYLNYATENTLSYGKKIGDHDITALIGYTYQQQNDDRAEFRARDFTDDDIETMNAAARIDYWKTDLEDWSLISYLARATYGYKERYLLTAAIRRDGSSRFGQDNRWGIFPSASVGWRIIKEDFMKDISWLSDLKLRASYGIAGNFDIGNYTYYSKIEKENYVFGGTLAGGKKMETVGNPNLGWEKLHELDAGIEIGLFNDRIMLMADVYKRNTKSLLLDVEIPSSSGYDKAKENNGNLQNTGVELSITTRNITTDNFSWSTNANIAFNKNKVISLGHGNASITTGYSGGQNPTHITVVGKPAAQYYGFIVEGLYTEDDFNPDGTCKVPAFPGAIPGNIKMKDVNGDGQITEVSDFDVIGDPYPDFTWGMTNTLLYKGFDLRIQITGSMGGQLMNAQYEYTHNTDGIFNVTKSQMNRYRSPSQPGDGRTPTTAGASRGRVLYRETNSDWIEDNDYLWVKNITLGYTHPKKIAFISSGRLYLSIQNPILFSKFDGNPEAVNYGEMDKRKMGSLVPGVVYTSYPVSRVFTIGANITF